MGQIMGGHLTRQQEKAMFAKRNQGNPRSDVTPQFIVVAKGKKTLEISRPLSKKEANKLIKVSKFASAKTVKFSLKKVSPKPKLPTKVSDFIGKEISRQRKEGRPQAQSIAIALSKARKKFPRQARRLTLMGNPNGKLSQKRIRNLLVTLFGLAIALQILRRIRKT